jgi:hypothetical protein
MSERSHSEVFSMGAVSMFSDSKKIAPNVRQIVGDRGRTSHLHFRQNVEILVYIVANFAHDYYM